MRVRKNVAALTPAEKTAYRNAVLALKNSRPSLIPAAQSVGAVSRWDDYVWIHLQVGFGAHRGAAFTPWHREFLRQLELDLREASGNNQICIPYWDWSRARQPSDAGWPFTADFMGEMGSGLDNRVPATSPFGEPANPADSQWVLNVRTNNPGGPNNNPPRDNTTYLRRQNPGGGDGRGSLPSLNTVNNTVDPTNPAAYDAGAFTEGIDNVPVVVGDLLVSFRKALEYACHNGPHVWVGGAMEPMTSPNDPIFFLHHCNIDRLWATWQQKQSNWPNNLTDHYLPTGSAGAHALDSTMSNLDPTRFNHAVKRAPREQLDHHANGVWYDTDIPIVTLDTPSVNFGSVPEGLTTYRPVEFTIRTGRRVNFRITALGGAGFSIPPEQGAVVPIDPNPVGDVTNGEVYLAYTSPPGGGMPAAGSAAIEAFIVDTDGFYAASPGQEFIVGSWPVVTFVATPIPRPRNVVTLILDRSGSMSAPAGGTGTRADLLRTAVQVFADLLAPTDGIGLVTYDGQFVPNSPPVPIVDRVLEVVALGPSSPPGPGRQQVASILSSTALDPRGLTGIGAGIIEGADVLADGLAVGSPPYDSSAMIVMTDGNENVDPRVSDPSVQAVLTTRTFAVGLGRAGEVSEVVLGAVAGGTGGFQLVTGDVSSAAQRFKLSKYFVQIVAGMTNTQVIVDPDGDLHLGVDHRVPFEVSAADVRIDAILLSPAAPVLRWVLETPDGSVLDPQQQLPPNVEFVVNRDDTFMRVGLPADPADPSGTHVGTWQIVVMLDRRLIRGGRDLLDTQLSAELIDALRKGSVPYSALVHAVSNLELIATVAQSSSKPGADVLIVAELREFNIPLRGRAEVHAIVTRPSGAVDKVALDAASQGRFEGWFATVEPGVYAIRIVALAEAGRGGRVRREETRTVSVFDKIVEEPVRDGRGSRTSGPDSVVGEETIGRLAECLGVDVDRVRKCLTAIVAETRPAAPSLRSASVEPGLAVRATRERLTSPTDPAELERRLRAEVRKEVLSSMGGVLSIEDLGVARIVEQSAVEDPEPVMEPHHHDAFLPIFDFDGDEPRLVLADPQMPGHDGEHGATPRRRKAAPKKVAATKAAPARTASARKAAARKTAKRAQRAPRREKEA